MSTEINKGYIEKKKKGSSEYDSFYQEGIEILQKLSGEVWTDYNIHDPGVTILENLSYNLTQLSYVTQFPVLDLLTSSKGSALNSGDQSIYPPSEILTTNPVTVKDYRKLLIDQVTNVKNVWLIPHESSIDNSVNRATNLPIMGLYDIYVDLYNYFDGPSKMVEESERIKNSIKHTFFHARNIGEDINEIHILNPVKIGISLQLKINENADGEEVFANALYLVQNYLSPEVKFNSLQNLIAADLPLEEIFDGPQLEFGFIEDTSLKEKLTYIKPKEIIKLISTLTQIINVDKLELYIESNQDIPSEIQNLSFGEDIMLPQQNSWTLQFPSDPSQLKFEQKGLLFSADLDEIHRQLSYIETKNYGVYKSENSFENFTDLPIGKILEIGSYYPLREQFPLIYGVGHFGLPSGLPNQRYAQAKQLSAYLLPFDQLMQNYLSQLNNLFNLYNVGPIKGNTIQQNSAVSSYFYAVLDDMINLTHLIHMEEGKSNYDPNEKLTYWKTVLDKINKQLDNKASERLNAIADHLLARYNENYPTYAITKINTASFGKDVQPELELDMLNNKRKLLAHYASISYNRNKAFSIDHISSISKFAALPKIIEKMALIMNITDCSTRKLSQTITDSGLKIYKKDDGINYVSKSLETILGSEKGITNAFDSMYIIDEHVESLSDSFYFIGNHQLVLKKILREGIKRENYQIKSLSDKRKYFTLFNPPNESPYISHITTTKNKAEKEIQKTINFLNNLNRKSEGIHAIENLTLSPPYSSSNFGFTFDLSCLPFLPISFEHDNKQNYTNRNNTVSEICSLIGKLNQNCSIEKVFLGSNYALKLVNLKGVSIAQSTTRFETLEEVEQKIDLIKNTFKNVTVSKLTYLSFIDNEAVNEDFFSFQMSVFMPAWPARFQQDSFKSKFTNLLYEQAPAHIAFNIIWMELEDMIYFEEIYMTWLSLQGNSFAAEERKAISLQLIQLIQKRMK
jgi:hypothetical protein